MKKVVIVSVLTLVAGTASAQKLKPSLPAGLDAVMQQSFTNLPPKWSARLVQDETQRICSLYHNMPPPDEVAKIEKRESARIVLPTSGSVIGNWKAGEKIAESGHGGQITDKPGTVNGGNCYACHQLDPKEVAYGTLGPSLTGYGRERNYSAEDAKAAYAKIFDAEARLACSSMPRFGANGVLTEQQIKDVVAYLFDPNSPVNKK